MDKFYEDYVDRLKDLHQDCQRVVDGLPQEALDWKPSPDMNSIGVLVVHIIGAERYWVGDVVLDEPSGRQRDQEFATSGLNPSELSQRLDDALDYIEHSLGSLTLTALTEERASPRDGEIVTVGWSLLHVLKHTGLHLGHMEATRHMWEIRGQDR